jgi:hypothetical protein
MEATNPNLLNQIGIFIATHGLAVFLVVYYAVWMYPQLREERKDWIEQITRLRQLVDPETRPLTIRQAEVAFELAINAYLDKLRLQFRTVTLVGFGTARPSHGRDESSSMRRTNAFGEMVAYEPTLEDSDPYKNLQSLINRIRSLRKKRERIVRETLLRLFREVEQSAQSITHQLGKLRFGLTTLEGPWREAMEEVEELWVEKSKQGFSYFHEDDLSRLELFFQEHPGYEEASESMIEMMQDVLSPGELKTEDMIQLTGGVLQRSLNNLIKNVSEHHAVNA